MKKFSFLAAVCALLVAAAPALAATELSVFAAASMLYLRYWLPVAQGKLKIGGEC